MELTTILSFFIVSFFHQILIAGHKNLIANHLPKRRVFGYNRDNNKEGGIFVPNLLICDDEADIVEALRIYLSDPSYKLFTASTGLQALEILNREQIHLVLMDIMMPGMDGITALRRIREVSNIPVILLTAKTQDEDKILGLDVGADDYITKPFNPAEVQARVRSQLRRYLKLGSDSDRADSYVCGGIEMHNKSKTVTVDGESVSLTPKEYDILKLLLSNQGKVFSPKEIYQLVWNERPFGTDNTVAVHSRHLREKVEINPAEPRYIKVLFGQGYVMEQGGRR